MFVTGWKYVNVEGEQYVQYTIPDVTIWSVIVRYALLRRHFKLRLNNAQYAAFKNKISSITSKPKYYLRSTITFNLESHVNVLATCKR
jgi:hypothetical protein